MNQEPSHPQDEAIRARIRESFEQSVTGLDPATGNRLRLIRREVLAGPRPTRKGWGLPLAAAAVAVLALGVAWRTGFAPTSTQADPEAPRDEVVATGFPSEEEADLYAWLAEAPVAPAEGHAL